MTSLQQEKLKSQTIKNCTSTISSRSTKSTSKFKNVSDYIWSKLTSSRKNSSSLNISKTTSDTKLLKNKSNLIESNTVKTTNEQKEDKKQRRNIFHIFDSSSKLKLGSGVNKKNAKNKNSGKKQDNQQNISTKQEENSNITINEPKIEKKSEEVIEPEIETLKPILMDNSMLKSKIQAAARRNPRNRPSSSTSSITSSLTSNTNKQTSIQIQNNERNSTSSIKTKMDAIEEVSKDLENEKTEVIEEKSRPIEMSSVSEKSICEKTRSISSITCSPSHKSIEIPDTNETEKIGVITNEFVKIEPVDELKVKTDLKELLNLKSSTKIAIYDNNLTNKCSSFNKTSFSYFNRGKNNMIQDSKSKSCERIDLLKFKTSLGLANRNREEDDEQNAPDLENKNSKNTNISHALKIQSRFSYLDPKSIINNSNTNDNNNNNNLINDENNDKNVNLNLNNNKSLNYSKSLKLQAKSFNCKQNNKLENLSFDSAISDKTNLESSKLESKAIKKHTTSFSNGNSNINNSSRILMNKNLNKDQNLNISTNSTNGEPVWKELAFKKHNAWNQINLENGNHSIITNNEKSSQENLNQTIVN